MVSDRDLVIDMTVVMNRTGLKRLRSRRSPGSFLADQRGAVAFEMPIVYLFMLMVLLLPLSDVASFGFQFISAWEALRAFGQYVQYNPPADVTNTTGWPSTTTVVPRRVSLRQAAPARRP